VGYVTRRLSQAMHALHAVATNALWMSTMQVCPPVAGRTRRHRTLGNFAAFNETNAAIARWNDATQRLAAAYGWGFLDAGRLFRGHCEWCYDCIHFAFDVAALAEPIVRAMAWRATLDAPG